jgi:hypothetical protein
MTVSSAVLQASRDKVLEEKFIGWISDIRLVKHDRCGLALMVDLCGHGQGTGATIAVKSDTFYDTVVKLLDDARVEDVAKLKGKPVEVTFNNGWLKDWRILTEVIPK